MFFCASAAIDSNLTINVQMDYSLSHLMVSLGVNDVRQNILALRLGLT